MTKKRSTIVVIGKIGIIDVSLIRYLKEVKGDSSYLSMIISGRQYGKLISLSHIEEFLSSLSLVDDVATIPSALRPMRSRSNNTLIKGYCSLQVDRNFSVLVLPDEDLGRYSWDRIRSSQGNREEQETIPSISSKAICLEELASLYPHREARQKIGLVSGSFDLIHLGHVRHINNARRLCDVLVVATMSTSSLRAQEKNAKRDRPIYSQADRITVLSALRSVDHIVVFDEPDCKEVIRALRPHIFFKNIKDMNRKVVIEECDLVRSLGGKVNVTYDSAGYSSTDLINYIRNCTEILDSIVED